MRTHFALSLRVSILVATCAFAIHGSVARGVPVTLRLEDQHGTELAGSVFARGSVVVPTGGSMELAIGQHLLNLRPGINGSTGSTALQRSETITIDASTTSLTFQWNVADVAIRIVDQGGQDIPGSGIWMVGFSGPTGRPTPLSGLALPVTEGPGVVGDYAFQVYPGVHGAANPRLYRRDPRDVTDDTSLLVFEWTVRPVTARIVDQDGADIPGSQVYLAGADPASGLDQFQNTPLGPLMLPTTTDAAAAQDWGSLGYQFHLRPGLDGGAGVNRLWRRHRADVAPDTSEIAFTWSTATVEVALDDQGGVPIAGSSFTIENSAVASLTNRPLPAGVVLPVTTQPGAEGTYATGGYPFRLIPGLGGASGTTTHLSRLDARHVGADEVQSGVLAFTWIRIACALALTEGSGTQVSGTLTLPAPFPAFHAGDLVNLPVTDNTTYPSIAGGHSNGYAVRVAPADVAPDYQTFSFEVLPGGGLEPALFSISGRQYGLTCDPNRVPEANAGPNVAISSADQDATTILGQVSDSDGDALDYRWLDGTTELLGWTMAGAEGSAPLDLGTIAPLAIGVHSLVLEVSDGTARASSSMLLTIGNSPPTAACAGAVVALGDDVLLGGRVADHDGDVVDFTWSEDMLVLAEGSVPTTQGGDPVALPEVVIATGAGGALGPGPHDLLLSVDDGAGGQATCTASIEVVDRFAPSLAPTVSPGILWPPNHQMRDIVVNVHASDDSGLPVTLTTSITSSEDPLKDGSGQTIPDWTEPVLDSDGDTFRFQLRAERSGRGPGRVYVVTITATDAAGNASTASISIAAPHDRRGG